MFFPEIKTQPRGSSFGYIMSFVPPSFRTLKEYINSKTLTFSGFKHIVDICIRIAGSVLTIHRSGEILNDLSLSNILADSKGEIRFVDNDNICPADWNTGINGTPKLRAPEMALGKPATKYSDWFSLALIICYLLFNQHPFEGKRLFLTPVLTSEQERIIYETGPLFIFDKFNSDNNPPRSHTSLYKIWGCFPEYLKRFIQSALSTEAIRVPEKRKTPIEWLNVLMRFRSEIMRCPACGNEVFIDTGKDKHFCDECNHPVIIGNWLKVGGYRLPFVPMTRIYRLQINSFIDTNNIYKLACRVRNSGGKLILDTCAEKPSSAVFYAKTVEVAKGEPVPLIPGLKFYFENKKNSIEII